MLRPWTVLKSIEHVLSTDFVLNRVFFIFVLRFLFTLSGVSKTWLFVVPFLFKCVLILSVFLFVGCTLSAMDFVCIMSAYHCCVRIQVGFQCFAIFVCVCVSCACIDLTVEWQVSVVIVSGFVLRSLRMQTFILGFSDWFLYLIFGNFVLRVAAFVPSMTVRRFWTAVSWL